jgi:hypothetical protein
LCCGDPAANLIAQLRALLQRLTEVGGYDNNINMVGRTGALGIAYHLPDNVGRPLCSYPSVCLSVCICDVMCRHHHQVSWLPMYHDMGLIGTCLGMSSSLSASSSSSSSGSSSVARPTTPPPAACLAAIEPPYLTCVVSLLPACDGCSGPVSGHSPGLHDAHRLPTGPLTGRG